MAIGGDINDFEFSETVDILVGDGDTALTDLPRTLPVAERYTYVFEGNSQVLDHLLLSPAGPTASGLRRGARQRRVRRPGQRPRPAGRPADQEAQ